jgi:hypothetical protein
MSSVSANQRGPSSVNRPGEFSQSIDWYAEGESRTVEVDGIRIEVRFTARKGRRSRIAITAPPGATFRSFEPNVTNADQSQ